LGRQAPDEGNFLAGCLFAVIIAVLLAVSWVVLVVVSVLIARAIL
jgi:hypothetical protein